MAVDADRALDAQILCLERERLRLGPLGILAANCPKCFGPPVGKTQSLDPQVLVCLDGNFQHKRHAKASVPIPGSQPPRPGLFLDPKLVAAKALFVAQGGQYDGDGVSSAPLLD